MKNMIMLSNLDLWSIEEGKGAPSFYNTVKIYVDKGWNINLIQPFSKYRKDYKVDGCKTIKFNNQIFDYLNTVPYVRFFSRFFYHFYASYMFKKKAKEIIAASNERYIIYAYEIFGVKAGKKISKKYNFPFVTRYQGTLLIKFKNNLINKIRKYPHFGALKTESDLVIMTDDGTQGDKILRDLNNKSKKIVFWKNGQDPIKGFKEIAKAKKDIRTKYKIKDDETLFLTVSRLKNWKKVERAIEVIQKLLEKEKKVKLIIVGDGEEYDNLVNLTKELNLEKFVLFTGSIKQEEVWKFYSAADIFLSLYDLSNVGNPLMEAMRYKKTIITLNNGDTGTIIENNKNGIILDDPDIDVITKNAIELIEDKAKAERLATKAEEYAKENFLTWQDRMEKEEELVSKLI